MPQLASGGCGCGWGLAFYTAFYFCAFKPCREFLLSFFFLVGRIGLAGLISVGRVENGVFIGFLGNFKREEKAWLSVEYVAFTPCTLVPPTVRARFCPKWLVSSLASCYQLSYLPN